MTLENKVALVTGASRGIGLVIARVLAEAGMRVAVNGSSEGIFAAAQTLKDEGLTVHPYRADVSRKQDVQAMVQAIEDDLGPLYLLVNNAGLLRTGPTVDLSEEDWDATFDVDAKGVFLCSQAALQHMLPRREGRIVNVSSIAGQIVRVNQIAYCAAKAAAIHFTRCLAVETTPHGITVNCLCPGMTQTEMLLDSAVDRGLDLEAMVRLIPHGRMALPEEHAALVIYFASAAAAHVTGQVVAVDGGQSQFLPLTPLRGGGSTTV